MTKEELRQEYSTVDLLALRAMIDEVLAERRKSWKELIITDGEGFSESLPNVVDDSDTCMGIFVDVEFDDGVPISIPYYFIALPGEDPNFDTPKEPINWDGFEDAVEKSLKHYRDIRWP